MTLKTSDVFVTTIRDPPKDLAGRGRELASSLAVPYLERRRDTVRHLLQTSGARAALVCGAAALRFVHAGRSLEFHPNMARHRVVALAGGREDRFVSVAALRPGDEVLDCTCGLAADAVVAAYAVGAGGRVRACEASPVLAAIVRDGLARYEHADRDLVAAMRRVEIVTGDASSLLAQLRPRSADVVCFDPMFDPPLATTGSPGLVHLLGETSRPDRRTLEQARRVARRTVVVKDRAPGKLLAALGVPVVSDSGQIWFGRLAPSS